MRVRCALSLTLLSLLACQPADSPAVDEAEIQSEVVARVEGYFQAIRDLDLEYMEGFWADVEGFTVAGDGVFTVGYEPWMGQLRDLVASIESVEYVDVDNANVYVLGPDAASYAMTYRWRFNMADGSTLSAEGSWMYVLQRIQGQWQVVHSAGAHIYS